jgi:hypothetical protein
LVLWPAPDPKESFKIPKMDDDGTLSVRNFILMMVPILKSRFESNFLVAYVACSLEATKIEKMQYGHYGTMVMLTKLIGKPNFEPLCAINLSQSLKFPT